MTSDKDRKSLYPLEPGFQNTDTSRAAAAEITSHADVLRRKCLGAVRAAARHDPGVLLPGVSPKPGTVPDRNAAGEMVGLTTREASAKLGDPHYNIHPRFSELRRAGLIRDSGVRRLNAHSGKKAICWVPGDDPDKPALQSDNAPPTKPAQRQSYVRGMAAAFYTVESLGESASHETVLEALRRRLSELEPGNSDWSAD